MRRIAGIALLVAGCGRSSAGEPDADPSRPDAPAGLTAGELTVLDGGGLGHLWFAPVVFGGFPVGGPPVWHQEIASAGACRVLAYQLDFCDPPCDGLCQAPATCVPWPVYRSAGALTVTGLAAPLVLEPLYDHRYTTTGGLPDPLFASDATIAMSAGGDVVPAFTVDAPAVRQLTVPAFDAAGRAILVDGADATITWPDPDPSARVQLVAHSGGAPHGTPPEFLLECDVPDTGTLVIPRAAIEALPALSEGCPKGHDCAKLGIARYQRRSTTTDDGTVSLRVMSGIDYPVVHDPQ